MVNVGGRSKGCSTCRQRRVKCGKPQYPAFKPLKSEANCLLDETTPVCLRCKKRGLDCNGVKSTTFVHHKSVKLESNASAQEECSIRRRESLSPAPHTHMKGFETQIFISYARQHLFRDGPVDLALQELHINDIQAANDSISDHLLLHRAILSLAIIFFGHHERMSWVRERGYLLYGTTLQQLNQLLAKQDCQTRDDVLMSVVILAMLEIFIPTGKKYYLKHMLGLERLLELRGPSAFYRQKPYLAGVRRLILFSALEMRTRSILAEEQWKSVVWDDRGDDGFFFNALADITPLRAEQDRIKSGFKRNEMSGQHATQQLISDAKQLLNKLRNFKTVLETRNKTLFSEISTATIPLLYNTALILVLQVLSSCSDDADERHNYSIEARRTALNICQKIPYFVARKDELDVWTSTIISLAARTAMSAFGEKSCLARMCISNLVKRRGEGIFAEGIWSD